MTDTKGNGIMNSIFSGYEEYKGDIPQRSRGSLVVFETGEAITYGLFNAQERGILFIEPGTGVYQGMIAGECSRADDIEVNVCKKKHLSNTRASGSDDALKLTPVRKMSLEQCLEFIKNDELVEITPKSIRMRKRILNAEMRKKAARETTDKNILYGGNKMEKKIIKIVAKVWIAIMVIIIGYRGYYISIIKKPLKNINGTEVRTIDRGDTVKSIINKLKDEGKLKNSLLIRLYMKLNPADISVKKSEITISDDMSLDELLLAIDQAEPSADSGVARVTIPEGKNLEEIAAILEEKGIITKKDFMESCQKYELPSYIKKDSNRKYPLEGYLFPDTYDFIKGSSGKAIIKVMLRNFENRIQEVRANSSKELRDEDIDSIIILASMIEEEVQVAEERPLVSWFCQ